MGHRPEPLYVLYPSGHMISNTSSRYLASLYMSHFLVAFSFDYQWLHFYALNSIRGHLAWHWLIASKEHLSVLNIYEPLEDFTLWGTSQWIRFEVSNMLVFFSFNFFFQLASAMWRNCPLLLQFLPLPT